ncbi:MAG: CPBP family intramembrane glutamic endopeptidase [Thermomicrobiales bacterium]
MEVVFAAIAALVAVLAVWGLVFWAHKATRDRSAFVGLYLLLGIPGTLLIVAGIAYLSFGKPNGFIFLAAGLSCVMPLFKQLRQFVAQFTPLDPMSPLDMCGLAIVFLIFTFGGATLALEPTPSSEDVSLAEVFVQALAEIGIAFAAVGLWIYRTPRQATDRLGLVRLTVKLASVAAGFLILALIMNAVGVQLMHYLQPGVVDDYERVLKETASGSHNPIAALIFGLSAGVGEELVFRGVLQPRFGLVVTAMLFTAVHVQYGATFILLGIFGSGLVLGFERKHFGTTACILTHMMVDTLAALLSS